MAGTSSTSTVLGLAKPKSNLGVTTPLMASSIDLLNATETSPLPGISMDSIEAIKQINEKKKLLTLEQKRFAEDQLANLQTQEVILRSFRSLVDYLENRIGKTVVLNQLKEIGTPDALLVMDAVNSLHETIKSHENTDLTEITSVMRELLEEARQIPKELPEQKEIELQDYTKQFSSLESAVRAVEKVVKQQKLVAEAPIINVPEANVQVEAPDLKPLQTSIKDVVRAIKSIVIPEYKTDNAKVEKLIQKSNKLLTELLEKPVGGGGGGSSRATPYGMNGVPTFVELVDGKVPVSATLEQGVYKKIIDDTTTANVTYIGEAALGTATSAASWRIKKIDESSGVVITWSGTGFDAIWNNRATTVGYS